jgi:RHS repeat-associated protein
VTGMPTHHAARRHRRRTIPLLAVVAALSLAVGVIAGIQFLGSSWGPAPATSAGKAVTVHAVHGRTVKVPAMRQAAAPHATWPGAGTSTTTINAATSSASHDSRAQAGPSAGSGRAGSLPVWIGPADTVAAVSTRPSSRRSAHGSGSPADEEGAISEQPVTSVRVTMASHGAATALGVRGVVFSVARADGSSAPGRVHVSLDYSQFADAYGGTYASRMHLVELPSCALTTPQVPACRTPIQAGSADDVRTSMVGADINLPGNGASVTDHTSGSATPAVLTAAVSSSASQVILAAEATYSGSGGNYAAEPLSEMDEWVNGGSSGAYVDSYPIQVPPVPGGLEPTVSLNYDSQSADGRTNSTNNEASWIGDGWDYQPGYVEVDYDTCASNALEPDTGDLCSDHPIVTMTLNGSTTTLIGTGTSIAPENDGGEKVIQGSNDWEIITPDGTQYWFGLNDLPGYTSGDPSTNSLWTVPVYDDGLSSKPWRYMLSYVVDPHGNAVGYFYNTTTNYYAESNGSTGTGQYTQGGTLAKIEYGLRAGSVYTSTPAAQVTFTTSSTVRQDAPTDLTCAKNTSCSVTAPTFWTPYALSSITTQSLISGSLQNVDSWSLTQTYPATGDATTAPSLWLSSIARTGEDGTTPVTLPATTFAGTPMPNLVDTSADTKAGYSLITRERLTSITNAAGGVTTVAYSSPDTGSCAVTGTFPTPYANTSACYPSYMYTSLVTLATAEEWYNLYSVSSVTNTDTTGGDPPVVTSYTYASPGWHYDNDTISRSAAVTWDEWRGYKTVATETGTAPDPVTEVSDTYFQGLSDNDGPYTQNGGVQGGGKVTLTSTHGNQEEDLDQYAGSLFEKITYNGAGTGSQVTDVVNLPWTSSPESSSSTTIDGDAVAEASYETGYSSTDTYTALASGGTRESTVTDTYNSYGEVLTDSDVPDTTNGAESTCTTTTYNLNTSTSVWIVDLPSTVVDDSGACGTTGGTLISDTQDDYDGHANGVAPTAGNLTETQEVTSASAPSTFTAQKTETYDEYGRVLTSTDADSRTTTTAYTPTTGAEPTSVSVTDPMGLVTTTTYDPARELSLTVTDPAGYVTTTAYDALGRKTSEWTPGNPATGPAVDTWSYTSSSTAPWVTTEQVEEPDGNYLATESIMNAFGQDRETQQETAKGGANVIDTAYNSDGWKSLVSGPYYTSSAPSTTLVSAASSSVPAQTGFVYDGDGRVIRQIAYALGTETWETDTAYGGNYTTVVPPAGGTSQTTFTDGRGLTTAIWQYHAGVTASASDPAADYDQTAYTYAPAGKLAGITDAAGNKWSYSYDLNGDQLTQTTPDAGTTTNTYDNAGQLTSTTDARHDSTSWTYDADGRKIAEYNGPNGSSGDELASWTYDTLAKGQLTSSTWYNNGTTYTEAVTGYNSQELASGTETVIPAQQGALDGTYTQTYTYAPSGQETSYTDSAAGGLPAETVTTGYDNAGNADSLNGASPYVDSLTRTDLGQPLQYTMGTSGEPAYITDAYDPQTGNLTQQDTQTGTAETSVDDLNYTYNNVSDVTSEADTPPGNASATDVQCFQYDYLGRLAQAWAQGSAGCASTPSASAEGGAAPYWDSYTYNTIGNLTGVTSTTPAGTVTTTADTYPAAGSAQPHAIASQAVTTSSGTTSTGYGYDAAGHLTSVGSPSQSETLAWNGDGTLSEAAVTPSGGSEQDTWYVYDADGNLLLTADPGTTTLYLADEELTLNSSTGTVTGTRYYSIGGTTIATRAGASSVAYLAGDQQGTESVAISASTLAITSRYYDPYGNSRGTTGSGFPDGEKGFIGGTDDTATGLTNLGDREYQPASGEFISTDSILEPYVPQDLSPYAYAEDNPATLSDSSGNSSTPIPLGCPPGSKQQVEDCALQQQSEECPGCTAPGTGKYYVNDTPINIPQELPEDYRPFDSSNAWVKYGDQGMDDTTIEELGIGVLWLQHKDYDIAADLINHWTDASGTAYQLSVSWMLSNLPWFDTAVENYIREHCTGRAKVCNSGWQSIATWKIIQEYNKEGQSVGPATEDIYYALDTFQWRVSGYSNTDGKWYITVDVFKRYNFGNPNGGLPDAAVGGVIPANAVAQLNADGYARDFNVWGSLSITISPVGAGWTVTSGTLSLRGGDAAAASAP